MVFSSLTFLFFFLPACLIVYYAFGDRNIRNFILTAFSLLFYAWGEPIWIGLLIFSATMDYNIGLFIERYRSHPVISKVGLIASITVNLALLVSFKYADLIVETVNALAHTEFNKPGILLPIGISFYTFQTMSYIVDVYRGEVKAQKKLLNFMLFVVCFHQLVAGPIVRYAHIAREIEERNFDLDEFSHGVTRFTKGLFKKVFFANVAGELANQFLGQELGQSTVLGEWFGLLMYSLQIYFDFSGYSDMAIGLGLMFGFHYHENFNHPYLAKSITDFWRRWHISLGTFFRDYVYIPLGGNRKNQTFNIFLVWGLTGLWHGASWNFVIWGLYFGLILWLEKIYLLRKLETAPAWVAHGYALLLVYFGWAIFYFTDHGQLMQSLQTLFALNEAPFTDFELSHAFWNNIYWLMLAVVSCTPIYTYIHQRIEPKMAPAHYRLTVIFQSFFFLAVSVVLLVGKTYNPFIYFRF